MYVQKKSCSLISNGGADAVLPLSSGSGSTCNREEALDLVDLEVVTVDVEPGILVSDD